MDRVRAQLRVSMKRWTWQDEDIYDAFLHGRALFDGDKWDRTNMDIIKAEMKILTLVQYISHENATKSWQKNLRIFKIANILLPFLLKCYCHYRDCPVNLNGEW